MGHSLTRNVSKSIFTGTYGRRNDFISMNKFVLSNPAKKVAKKVLSDKKTKTGKKT